MNQLRIQIKLKSPVVISSQSGDSTLTPTQTYIPGTTVLGLLAGRYLKKYVNSESPESQKYKESFNRIFLRGGVHFQNLYPCKGPDLFLPCPSNIRRKKSNPDEFDNLFENQNSTDVYSKVDAYARRLDDYIDIYAPQTEVFFHHKRNYDKGISETGVVFNYEGLLPDQEFTGCILGKEEDINVLKELLEEDRTLRIGKSKTSQYGNTILTECKMSEMTILQDQNASGKLMVMISDTIIKNSAGISTIDLSDLERYLHVRIERASIDANRIETIVNAHRAKKPSDIAFKAGSTFLLKDKPPNQEDLIKYGLGERTWEGFGQICFPDAMKSTYNLLSSNSAERDKDLPDVDPPEIVKQLAASTINQIINSFIYSKAEDLAYTIGKGKLSNSLLGRLESFASTGNFAQNFAQIRDLSRQNIHKVIVGKEHFDEYLENIDDVITDLIKYAKALKLGRDKRIQDLIDELSLSELNIESYKTLYLKTLFQTIRRINNQHEGAR